MDQLIEGAEPDATEHKKRVSLLHLLVGLTMTAVAAAMLLQVTGMEYMSEFGPGAGFFPTWVNGALLVVGLIYLVRVVLRKEHHDAKLNREQSTDVLIVMGAVVAFAAAVPILGFLVSISAVVFVLYWRTMRWLKALIATIVTVAAIVLLFGIALGVTLPQGILGI